MTKHTIPSHFDDAKQAYEASKLGVWLFLVTEILLFGGLFVIYIMNRGLYPEMFHEASLHLNKVMGAMNTVVLICSSFTMAMAVSRAKHNDSQRALKLLLITFICGLIFMTIKYMEYSHKIHEGLLPGIHFSFDEISHPKAPLFFSLYFMMTGLHGLHVLVGMGLIFWVMVRTRRGDFDESYHTPVEMTGIYWHLVDLIWIYLFPLLYLIG
ncbi:MAG: cytochrome C oxidase subunit III [Deltaproteobacteria bacterium GWA2_38_16]|nr:MAG: cytochrome C oxidase subunit III [Deltaproteobacteria bacterium GWA2_38_16]OGQ03712.1 MAG: cytochrome C oxidase subunit III [Deltaproteobacteria bacterium RIFCSPHIGHO2_02_FULL_38_15]OGQ33584.1 MAG: cytochrome C oxidase subunit III [Deltaproteobacteria bacterium RIFCSPLOWO2_01_FULL_38_9]